jgi:GNAT superfamily N-acetyltransferase
VTAETLRVYESLWAETDPTRCAGLIARCLAENIEIIGPGYRLVGRAAVAAEVVRFHRERPGSKALMASGIDAHSGWARFEVKVVNGQGATVDEGWDVVEFGTDGRIRRVVSFWGPLPRATETAPPVVSAADAVTFEVHDDVPADLARAVDVGLEDSNARAAPMNDVRGLSCFARVPAGAVIGGAIGRTWGECCELRQLWVDAAHRRTGLGANLVRRFEQHASTRGCVTFYLDTFSFMAPQFYRKLGYEPALEIAGFAPGIVKYIMLKSTSPRARGDPRKRLA